MLRTEALTKKFDAKLAVSDLNISVNSGEIYGFLGPNGAGKTTTIRLLLGLLKPSEGSVFLFDSPMSANALHLKRRIGVVAEEPLAGSRMTAWEFVNFFADLNGVRHAGQKMEDLFTKLSLWDVRHALVSTYSRGMRQKLSLIRALVHEPDLLILDEPVSGLDPYGILEVRGVIEDHRQNGGAVLISSHILSEVEHSADRVGILHQGHLLVEDSIDGVRNRVGGAKTVQMTLVEMPAELPKQLMNLPGVDDVEVEDAQLTIQISGDRDVRPEIFQVVVDSGGVLVEMNTIQMSLEKAFVTITNQNVEQLAGAA